MKKITIISAIMFCALSAFAQNGELPPTSFDGNTNICDTSHWKLVFQDDFNGNSLKPPWITFISWLNMPGGDNDNWGGARLAYGADSGVLTSIFEDNNVVVSNGTVKLKIKKEQASWTCDTCPNPPANTNYTSAALCLPYTLPFNNGKFEAQIKMPTFQYAHAAFWTWYGAKAGVDELDIAESHGMGPSQNIFHNQPHTNYNLHAWQPGYLNTPQNPYNLPYNAHVGERYPGQSWVHWITNTGFDQGEFHTYTCEWDPNVVRFSVDNDLVKIYWRYYKTETYSTGSWPFRQSHSIKVGSTCVPSSGEWKTLPGFPWRVDSSYSNLRFTTGVDYPTGNQPDGFLGQMEINYVKIWERHPSDGWIALCDAGDVSISGPSQVCGSTHATYTVSNPSPTGYWEVTPNLSVISSSNSSLTVAANPSGSTGNLGATGKIKYFPTSDVCPSTNSPAFVQKYVVAGKMSPLNEVVSRTVDNSNQTYYYNLSAIFAENDHKALIFMPASSVAWDIDYGFNYSHHYEAYGMNVMTPPIEYDPNQLEEIKWTLKITNQCGTNIIQGGMNYLGLAIVNQIRYVPNQFYVSALIPDMSVYDSSVNHLLSQTMLPEGSSDTAIQNLILEKNMEALAPYIIRDTVVKAPGRKPAGDNNDIQSKLLQTKVFPNPANHSIAIIFGEGYKSGAPIDVKIFDNLGRIVLEKQVYYENSRVVSIDISALKDGIYLLNLKQKGKTEHLKVVKTSNQN